MQCFHKIYTHFNLHSYLMSKQGVLIKKHPRLIVRGCFETTYLHYRNNVMLPCF